jgi:hypothetical protein
MGLERQMITAEKSLSFEAELLYFSNLRQPFRHFQKRQSRPWRLGSSNGVGLLI